MLQLVNRTPFAAKMMGVPDAQGIESLLVLVKATFRIGAKRGVAEDQLPIADADDYSGEPGASSLGVASDVGLPKPGTDVLLVGSAHAPGGTSACESEVSLRVGPIHKRIRIVGDRCWDARGERPSQPEPFETMPLVWERAFGGVDDSSGSVEVEERNPVGVGFRAQKSRKMIEGEPLPNIEDPEQPMRRCDDRPTPVGVGPTCPHWLPRRSYAGTYDDGWLKTRSPFLPTDFDARFFQLAPPDQVTIDPLIGGELVEIVGATAGEPLRFPLPACDVHATFRLDGNDHRTNAVLDVVLIEPEESRLVMLWRALFPCDKKTLRVREVELGMDRRSKKE